MNVIQSVPDGARVRAPVSGSCGSDWGVFLPVSNSGRKWAKRKKKTRGLDRARPLPKRSVGRSASVGPEVLSSCHKWNPNQTAKWSSLKTFDPRMPKPKVRERFAETPAAKRLHGRGGESAHGKSVKRPVKPQSRASKRSWSVTPSRRISSQKEHLRDGESATGRSGRRLPKRQSLPTQSSWILPRESRISDEQDEYLRGRRPSRVISSCEVIPAGYAAKAEASHEQKRTQENVEKPRAKSKRKEKGPSKQPYKISTKRKSASYNDLYNSRPEVDCRSVESSQSSRERRWTISSGSRIGSSLPQLSVEPKTTVQEQLPHLEIIRKNKTDEGANSREHSRSGENSRQESSDHHTEDGELECDKQLKKSYRCSKSLNDIISKQSGWNKKNKRNRRKGEIGEQFERQIARLALETKEKTIGSVNEEREENDKSSKENEYSATSNDGEGRETKLKPKYLKKLASPKHYRAKSHGVKVGAELQEPNPTVQTETMLPENGFYEAARRQLKIRVPTRKIDVLPLSGVSPTASQYTEGSRSTNLYNRSSYIFIASSDENSKNSNATREKSSNEDDSSWGLDSVEVLLDGKSKSWTESSLRHKNRSRKNKQSSKEQEDLNASRKHRKTSKEPKAEAKNIQQHNTSCQEDVMDDNNRRERGESNGKDDASSIDGKSGMEGSYCDLNELTKSVKIQRGSLQISVPAVDIVSNDQPRRQTTIIRQDFRRHSKSVVTESSHFGSWKLSEHAKIKQDLEEIEQEKKSLGTSSMPTTFSQSLTSTIVNDPYWCKENEGESSQTDSSKAESGNISMRVLVASQTPGKDLWRKKSLSTVKGLPNESLETGIIGSGLSSLTTKEIDSICKILSSGSEFNEHSTAMEDEDGTLNTSGTLVQRFENNNVLKQPLKIERANIHYRRRKSPRYCEDGDSNSDSRGEVNVGRSILLGL